MTSPNKPSDKMLNMESGLLSISDKKNVKDSSDSLPSRSVVQPSDSQIESHLHSIIHTPTIKEDLLKILKPQLKDRMVLSPVEFNDKMYAVIDGLKAFIEQNSDKKQNTQLQALIELISKEEENRDLLQEFRMMLLQG